MRIGLFDLLKAPLPVEAKLLDAPFPRRPSRLSLQLGQVAVHGLRVREGVEHLAHEGVELGLGRFARATRGDSLAVSHFDDLLDRRVWLGLSEKVRVLAWPAYFIYALCVPVNMTYAKYAIDGYGAP